MAGSQFANGLLPNTGPLDKLWKPKVTRIIDMWTQPCNINPLVWVTAYIAASPTIAFSFLSPDCIDHAYDRFRQGKRPGRRGSMNMADSAKPINLGNSGLNQWAFSIGGWAQRAGFYLTLIDATQDWIIHGTSFAYQWSGCQDPNQGHASLSMNGAVPMLFPAQTGLIDTWSVDSAVHLSAGPGGIAIPRGFGPGIGYSLSQRLNVFPPLPDCNFSSRLVDVTTGWKGPWSTGGAAVAGIKSHAYYNKLAGDADASHLFRVEVQKDAGVLCVDGTMTGSGLNLEGLSKSACGQSNQGGL